ncbi:MAG: Ribosomal RNA small subunit methyltransferase B [Syntrophus sp. SKADARSKE-3]|nr:Ribosomal RNA small subunit methyltransferase B [Syntrophus sp. SKADARSKE-3]MDQ5987705.1 Ribosomal RNA small subunit methyltransferase B [Syntrophus sp. SKADARSKE-3]
MTKKILPNPALLRPPLPLPRPLAVDILNRVEMDGAFAEHLLDQTLSRNLVTDERDRRLLTELVYGTLRMEGYLDWFIEQYYQGGIRTLEPLVRNTLRTALYQRFFTERIPDFAIVNEAVELVKKALPQRAALINAILRNIMRRHDIPPRPEMEESSPEFIAIVYSHPLWLVRRWCKLLGPQETMALCRADNQIPPIFVRVNNLAASRETVISGLALDGFMAKETEYSPDGLQVGARQGIPLRETTCYQNGFFHIQDEASQMIARLVAPKGGHEILDLCAGVGGKATHLAEIMGNQGRIIAVDINKKKLEALKALTANLGIRIVEPFAGDGQRELGTSFHGRFDRVLVDAPCSGTGTLRRAPEIKWRFQTRDIAPAAALQANILERAASYVKKRGWLVYATCSLLTAENEAVVRAFLETHKAFSLIRPEDIPSGLLDQEGYFKTYPHRHGTDGFFGAVMVRK